jgi:hypothetical protein
MTMLSMRPMRGGHDHTNVDHTSNAKHSCVTFVTRGIPDKESSAGAQLGNESQRIERIERIGGAVVRDATKIQ